LNGLARAHRDGLATAFDPLWEQIELLKKNFCEKNRGVVETIIKEYVERRVKERVTVEVNNTPRPLTPHRLNRSYLQVENAIERYHDQVANNKRDNEKLKAVVNAS